MQRSVKRVLSLLLTVILISGCLLALPGLSASAYDTDYPNTWKNTGNQVEDLIGVALTQVGYHGVEYQTGTKYGAWYGNTYAPWCGMFISWCANQAGIPTSVIIKSARANDFRLSGTYHYKTGYTPQRGDIVLYNPDDGNGYFFPSQNADGTYSRSQHVALVVSYNPADDTIQIVHGNATGDRVCLSTKAVSNICIQAFVTPPYTSGGGVVDPSEPDSDYVGDASGAHLRSGPGTENASLGVLPFGTRLDVLEAVKDTDGDTWYRVKVKTSGKEGYIFGELVITVKTPEEHKEEKDCINADSVRLRREPDTSTNGNIVTVLSNGQTVTVEEKTTDSAGDVWYKVTATVNGTVYTGYVFGEYVTVVSEHQPQSNPLANHNYVWDNDVRLRESPVDGTILTVLKQNQVVDLIHETTGSDGMKWYKLTAVVAGTSYTGYMRADFIRVNAPVTVTVSGWLDKPDADSLLDLGLSDTLAIRGWAYSDKGYTENVYQIDDGDKIVMASYERPDVTAYYGSACPGDNTGFCADVPVTELSEGSHTVTIYVRGGTQEKRLDSVTVRVVDTSMPVCSSSCVSQVSSDGFRIALGVEDPVGVAKVRFAVWTASHDQEDLIWTQVGLGNDGLYTVQVNTAEYLTADDTYLVHVYATDTFGNECCVKTFGFNPSAYVPAVIRYQAAGDVVCPADQTADYLNGEIRLSDEIPQIDGAVFLGWSRTENAQTADYLPGASVLFTEDTTLYAVFRRTQELTPGDINGDGLIDTADLVLLKQYLAGLCSAPVGSMDVTGDSLTDTADLVYMKRLLAGLV